MPSSPADPRAPRSPDDLLAEVHRRAGVRRRQRRKLGLAAGAAFVAVAAIPLALRTGSGDAQSVRVGDSTPVTTRGTMPTLPDGAPAFIVTGLGSEIRLMATDGTGVVRRIHLDAAHPGGADSVPAELFGPAAGPGTTLVPRLFSARSLQLSPDGGTVYYRDDSAGAYCMELRSVALGSGHAETIVPTQSVYTVQSYDVSPDGASVVYARQRTGCTNNSSPTEIVLRTIATGDERVLLTGERLGVMDPPEVSFSADGRHVALNRTVDTMWNTQVQIIDIDTAAVRTVPATPGCHFNQPRFAPVGDDLAVVEDCQTFPDLEGKDGLDAAAGWFKTAQRAGRLLLVDPTTGEVRRALLDPPEGNGFEWFRFDPSGRHLLYRLHLSNNGGIDPTWRLSLATGENQSLYPEPNPDRDMTLSDDADW